MKVYIELVFLENFTIDYFLLLLSGKISCIKPKHPAVASVFGAVYAVIMPLYSSGSFIETFFVLLFMCIICFGIKKPRFLLYTFVAATASASALFGTINLFFGKFQNGIFYEDDIFFVLALCSSLLSVGLYRLLIPFTRIKKLEQNIAVLSLCGKEISAFVDSGNSLYYKKFPVILINKSMLTDYKMPVKPLIIPYSSVGAYGALLGFKPEKVSLTYMDKTIELNCVVALCDHKFQKNFDALLHPDLILECV